MSLRAGGNVFVADEVHEVQRSGMKFDQRRQLLRRELAHMRPHSEILFYRAAQDALRLLHGERAALAEYVNEFGKSARGLTMLVKGIALKGRTFRCAVTIFLPIFRSGL